jgi:hypothetical protein
LPFDKRRRVGILRNTSVQSVVIHGISRWTGRIKASRSWQVEGCFPWVGEAHESARMEEEELIAREETFP